MVGLLALSLIVSSEMVCIVVMLLTFELFLKFYPCSSHY